MVLCLYIFPLYATLHSATYSFVHGTPSHTSLKWYQATQTPLFNIASVTQILQDLARSGAQGQSFTANDIAKLQQIAIYSNKTLQEVSEYLQQLSNQYPSTKVEQKSRSNSSISSMLLGPWLHTQPHFTATTPMYTTTMILSATGKSSYNNDDDDHDDDDDDDDHVPYHINHDTVYYGQNIADNSTHQNDPLSLDGISAGKVITIVGIAFSVIVILYLFLCCYCGWKRRRLIRQLKHYPRTQIVKTDSFLDSKEDHCGKVSYNAHGNTYTSEPEKGKHLAAEESKQWLLDRSQLVVFNENKLGSGAFCNVYKGAIRGFAPVCKVNPSLAAYGLYKDCMCAVKMLPEFADDIAVSDFMQEINFMKSLDYHPHLVCMLGVSIDSDRGKLLLIEYCDQGDLLHLVRAKKEEIISGYENDGSGLRMKDLASFAWQISNGMEYLSSIGCVHRDIAARNVLVNGTNTCKISDFGLCRLSNRHLYTGRGGRLPLKWMAPESLISYEYSTKSDVWSYAVLLFEMFSFGEVPYALMQTNEIREFLESGQRLCQPEYCPNEIYTLMMECWQYKPSSRPSFTDICSSLRVLLEHTSENYGYIDPTDSSSDFELDEIQRNDRLTQGLQSRRSTTSPTASQHEIVNVV